MLEMTDCCIKDGFLLAGFNTDTKIHGGAYDGSTLLRGGVILEGKVFNDVQDNEVMDIYDAYIRIIEVYNGGNIYLHNVRGIRYLASDNGKILGENCASDDSSVKLKLGVGNNTEIVCDCKYEVDEWEFRLIEGDLRTGAFLNQIKGLTES